MSIKFYEKWFAGWREKFDSEQIDEPILAFITQDTGDSASEKRKETVRAWVKGKLKRYTHVRDENGANIMEEVAPLFLELDNVPTSGFAVGNSVSRYATSNKLFRVGDPRGFEIEIPAANLSEIVQTCVIRHGVIEDELVYTKNGANLWLIKPNDSRITVDSERMVIKAKDLLVGDKVYYNFNELTYVGKKQLGVLTSFSHDNTGVNVSTNWYTRQYYTNDRYSDTKYPGFSEEALAVLRDLPKATAYKFVPQELDVFVNDKGIPFASLATKYNLLSRDNAVEQPDLYLPKLDIRNAGNSYHYYKLVPLKPFAQMTGKEFAAWVSNRHSTQKELTIRYADDTYVVVTSE